MVRSLFSIKKIMKGWLFLAIAIFLAGCTKNEAKLEFLLPKDVNEPCRILYYASAKDAAMIRETVVQIADGKGEVILPLRYPSVIYLFSPAQKQPAAILYGRRGDKFRISGRNGNVAEWEIKGNETTEALSRWRTENSKLIEAKSSEPERLNEAVQKFVKANPSSPAAAIMLYCYYTRRDHEKEFQKLRSSLAKDVLDDEWLLGALSQADLLTTLPDTPSVPKNIVLVGESGYADTIEFTQEKGVLLMFRSPSDSGVSIDSVKAVAGRNRKQKMAELYMDPDSMGWRRYLRKDTIKDIGRLWLPLGIADSMALTMGVIRTPYYIVIDPKGKKAYAGDDWEKAVKTFESIKP